MRCISLVCCLLVSCAAAITVTVGTQWVPPDYNAVKIVVMLRQSVGSPVRACSATLLNAGWALTAAHCVHDAQPQQLLLQYGNASQLAQLNAIHVHPDCKLLDKHTHNIALLQLATAVPLDSHAVQPVRLPAPAPTQQQPQSTAMLWGLNATGDVLQLLSVEQCSSRLGSQLPAAQICAGHQRVCNAASGAALMLAKAQIGIASWCAQAPHLTIFTEVAAYVDWISDTVGKASADAAYTRLWIGELIVSRVPPPLAVPVRATQLH